MEHVIKWLPLGVSVISLIVSFLAFRLGWVNAFNDYFKIIKKVLNSLDVLIEHIDRSDFKSDDDYYSLVRHLQKLEKKYDDIVFDFNLPKSDLNFEKNLQDDLYELYHLLNDDDKNLKSRCEKLKSKYEQKLNWLNMLIFF